MNQEIIYDFIISVIEDNIVDCEEPYITWGYVERELTAAGASVALIDIISGNACPVVNEGGALVVETYWAKKVKEALEKGI